MNYELKSNVPDDMFDEVNKITHRIIMYRNPKKLNWIPSYNEILTQMGKGDQLKNHKLLIYVVRRITELGYDICDEPFRLERYR